jgi:hypothetical protein
VNCRFEPSQLEHLDALAAARGLTRSGVIRSLVAAESVGAGAGEIPSEEEILSLLAGRARAGNVSALRALQVWHERQRQGKPQAPEATDRMAALEPPVLRVVS